MLACETARTLTCRGMAGALYATGLLSDGDAGLNYITSLAVLGVKICRMLQTGSAYATDATMRFMLSESPDTETCQEEQSSQPKKKPTARWTNPNLPHCEDARRCPTINVRYPMRS